MSSRTGTPSDRRAKLIRLTPLGEWTVDAGRATVSGIEQTITQVLGAEGHAELRRLLGRLLSEVGDQA